MSLISLPKAARRRGVGRKLATQILRAFAVSAGRRSSYPTPCVILGFDVSANRPVAIRGPECVDADHVGSGVVQSKCGRASSAKMRLLSQKKTARIRRPNGTSRSVGSTKHALVRNGNPGARTSLAEVARLAGCSCSYAAMISHGLDLHGPKADAARKVLSGVVRF